MNTPTPRLRHAALVLAAGASRRLGHAKQLVERDGETLLHRATRLALETNPHETLVVLGHEADAMAATIADLAVRRVDCADWAEGMAASLRAGVTAVDPSCTHVLVLLCDQLALDGAHLRRLVAAAANAPTRAVASAYAGVRGVPAMLPRAWFPRLLELRGDTGARELLRDDDDPVVLAAENLAADLDNA